MILQKLPLISCHKVTNPMQYSSLEKMHRFTLHESDRNRYHACMHVYLPTLEIILAMGLLTRRDRFNIMYACVLYKAPPKNKGRRKRNKDIKSHGNMHRENIPYNGIN